MTTSTSSSVTPKPACCCAYVDHHDPTYRWAERWLETYSTTGAAQFVEIHEQVREIPVPQYMTGAPAASAAKPLFADIDDVTPNLICFDTAGTALRPAHSSIPPRWSPGVIDL